VSGLLRLRLAMTVVPAIHSPHISGNQIAYISYRKDAMRMLGISVYGDKTAAAKLVGGFYALEEIGVLPGSILCGQWAAFPAVLYALGCPLEQIEACLQNAWKARSYKVVEDAFLAAAGLLKTPVRDPVAFAISYQDIDQNRMMIYSDQIQIHTKRIATIQNIALEKAVACAAADQNKDEGGQQNNWILYQMGAGSILTLRFEQKDTTDDMAFLIRSGYAFIKHKAHEIAEKLCE